MKENYPRFIQNKPSGNDKFEGQSQKRLSSAISQHIINTDLGESKDHLSKIIGLEGEWGSGKSNVVKLMENELQNKYYFFEYDAWGHQEDLQRRSFLETITKDLIERKILSGLTSSSIDQHHQISWENKLHELLAKRIIRVNKSIPKFNPGVLWTALALSITPISVFFAERYSDQNPETNILILLFMAFCPIIFGVIIYLISAIFNKEMRNIGYLLKVSKNENIETKNYETINEDEPTVAKFKIWLKSISDHLKNNKKLIIIFDNMDRLPADKVKELWSSIHTFFSEGGFENIWVIIPFDEKHLSCAFEKDNIEENKILTAHFINKTFPIVFRVAPPVITDFKKIFDTLFTEAFGSTETENQEIVNRIFRISKKGASVREIISFLNQLVALKSIWQKEIDLISMSIFIIYKDKFLNDPVREILFGDYSNVISKIKPDIEFLQRNISALVFGIDVDHADQIPMMKYIENCLTLDEGYDINTFADSNKQFYTILDETVKNFDEANIDKTIICLSKLRKESYVDNNILENLWIYISDRKYDYSLENQELSDIDKILISNTVGSQRKKIIEILCKQIQNFENFNGRDYFIALKDLKEYLIEKNIEIVIDLPMKTVNSQIFVEFAKTAKSEYSKFFITTDPFELDSYYEKMLPGKLINTEVILTLQEDINYTFQHLKIHLELIIVANEEITYENFESILFIYKALSNEKPLKHKIQPDTVAKLLEISITLSHNGVYPPMFYELVAMTISNGIEISVDLNSQEIQTVSECIEYYEDYGDLLEQCFNWKIVSLNEVLKYMTINQKGKNLQIDKILRNYELIKTEIEVTDEEFVSHLNNWSNKLPDCITQNNITSILKDPLFFVITSQINNDLTQFLNKTILEALKQIDSESLFENRKDYERDYWFIILNNLIDTELIKTLPDNLTEFCKKLIESVSNDTQTLPLPEIFQKIIRKLDEKKISSKIKDIRNDFCNDKVSMTPEKFLFFEELFRNHGNLKERNDRVTHTIIRPVITNSNCLSSVLSNSDYYADIINNAGDDALELKINFRNLLKEKNGNESILNFADKIGVKVDDN